MKKQKKLQHHHFFFGGVAFFLLSGAALGFVVLTLLAQRGAFGGHVHAFKPGQSISNTFYEVRIDNVKRSQGNPQSLIPNSGNEFLVVDLYIKNKSNRITQFFPSTQTYIKDASGRTYTLGVAELRNAFQAGDIAPGDNVKGELAYEIPANLNQPKLYVEGLASLPVVVQLK